MNIELKSIIICPECGDRKGKKEQYFDVSQSEEAIEFVTKN